MIVLCKILFVIVSISIQSSVQFEIFLEGDPCRNNDGSKGVCRKMSDCASAETQIKQGMRPKVCGFDRDEPILCCTSGSSQAKPPQTSYKPSYQPSRPSYGNTPKPPRPSYSNSQINSAAVSIAKRKCEEYAKSVFQEIDSPVLVGSAGSEIIDRCGTIEEALIVGGEKAKPREFPHMALIGYGKRVNNIQWLCGGSLISERYVLSAAHCSNPESRGPASWVKLGELDTESDYDEAFPEVIKIIQIIDHPQYKQPILYNDISLFKLERNVEFNEYIRPICLPTSFKSHTLTGIASGWGHTRFAGRASNHLLKVRLNLVTEQTCYDYYRNYTSSKQLSQGIIESQLCAGSERGKDSCQGDSGGPLQNPLKVPYCMYEILGVTSFGKLCGQGVPGVYTRVAHFLPWIVKEIWS